MRYAIFSDIHANREALEAVLERALSARVDRMFCLGDLVGYNAEPAACIELCRSYGVECIAGNHDLAAAGLSEPDDFGETARRALFWTRAHIDKQGQGYLATLPLTKLVDGRFFAVHGALHPKPNADLHLSTRARVDRSLRALQGGDFGATVCFYGHTHRAVVQRLRDGAVESAHGSSVALEPGVHYLVNPGSVGQPRDGDPRAAFAIFDANAGIVEFVRVPYDFAAAYEKARRAGLIYRPPRFQESLRRVRDLARREVGRGRRALEKALGG